MYSLCFFYPPSISLDKREREPGTDHRNRVNPLPNGAYVGDPVQFFNTVLRVFVVAPTTRICLETFLFLSTHALIIGFDRKTESIGFVVNYDRYLLHKMCTQIFV